MFILLLTMLALALAEPPVRDGYFTAVQSGHGYTTHRQYLPPDLRSSIQEISQDYGPPEFRDGLSQEYGTPNARNGASSFRNTLSQEYGAPSARFSQEYDSLSSSLRNDISHTSQNDALSLRNTPSNVYGVPSQRSSPSSQYGAPEFRSNEEYSSPSLRTSGFSYNRNSSPVQKYGVPRFHSSQSSSASTSQEYGAPSTKSNFGTQSFPQSARKSPSQTYENPGRSLATQYGAPEARNTVSYSQDTNRNLPTTYGAPSGKSLSQEYGAPESRTTDFKTNAYASSYSSARSPSQEYGAPSSHAAMPSQQYGIPWNNDAGSEQGYQYARNNLDLVNQEPANYEFAYKVSDYESGSDFGHAETRQQDRAEGAYFVLLPDGTKQVVEYEADEDGFKPRISVEPAVSASALAADGPY